MAFKKGIDADDMYTLNEGERCTAVRPRFLQIWEDVYQKWVSTQKPTGPPANAGANAYQQGPSFTGSDAMEMGDMSNSKEAESGVVFQGSGVGRRGPRGSRDKGHVRFADANTVPEENEDEGGDSLRMGEFNVRSNGPPQKQQQAPPVEPAPAEEMQVPPLTSTLMRVFAWDLLIAQGVFLVHLLLQYLGPLLLWCVAFCSVLYICT